MPLIAYPRSSLSSVHLLSKAQSAMLLTLKRQVSIFSKYDYICNYRSLWLYYSYNKLVQYNDTLVSTMATDGPMH